MIVSINWVLTWRRPSCFPSPNYYDIFLQNVSVNRILTFVMKTLPSNKISYPPTQTKQLLAIIPHVREMLNAGLQTGHNWACTISGVAKRPTTFPLQAMKELHNSHSSPLPLWTKAKHTYHIKSVTTSILSYTNDDIIHGSEIAIRIDKSKEQLLGRFLLVIR